MPKARTCSIEGLGQLRHPIPQMLIMVLRSIWRGSFATPPDVNVATGLCLTARTCSIEGLGRLRHPIPQVLIMVLRSIWRGSFATPPQMSMSLQVCAVRHRPVASRGWYSFAIPSLIWVIIIPHLYDNGAGASGVQCFAPPPDVRQ